MLTVDEVGQILEQLSSQNISETGSISSEDVACIVYRADLFECDDANITSRHLPLTINEQLEIIVYEKCKGDLKNEKLSKL